MRIRSHSGATPKDTRLRISLARAELEALRLVPRRLEEILAHPDRGRSLIQRLFPVTHPDDPELEAEHRALLGDSLLRERQENLAGFQATLDRTVKRPMGHRLELTAMEADLWLHVLNDLRLLLGVELGISSNSWWEEGPGSSADEDDFHFLGFLSVVQEELLRALSAS